MEEPSCPNYQNCQLVTGTIEVPKNQQDSYINLFCTDKLGKWQTCKRFAVKKAIDFCPDFVLPDTELSIEEIIVKFDDA